MSIHDSILGMNDITREAVPIPEWPGVEVYVKKLTAREKDAFDVSVDTLKGTKAERMENFRSRLVVTCLVDGDGNLIFAPNEADKLGTKCASAVATLFDVATRMNGMTKKDVEDATKN